MLGISRSRRIHQLPRHAQRGQDGRQCRLDVLDLRGDAHATLAAGRPCDRDAPDPGRCVKEGLHTGVGQVRVLGVQKHGTRAGLTRGSSTPSLGRLRCSAWRRGAGRSSPRTPALHGVVSMAQSCRSTTDCQTPAHRCWVRIPRWNVNPTLRGARESGHDPGGAQRRLEREARRRCRHAWPNQAGSCGDRKAPALLVGQPPRSEHGGGGQSFSRPRTHGFPPSTSAADNPCSRSAAVSHGGRPRAQERVRVFLRTRS